MDTPLAQPIQRAITTAYGTVPLLAPSGFGSLTGYVFSELRVDFERRALRDAIEQGDERLEVGILSSFHLLDRVESLPVAERAAVSARWMKLHRDYHAALVSACRSRWLLNFCGLLFAQAERYRLLSHWHRPKASSRKDEHRLMMQAAIDRNVRDACDLAKQYIRRTVDEVLRYAPQTQA